MPYFLLVAIAALTTFCSFASADGRTDDDLSLVTERTFKTATDETVYAAFHEGDRAYVTVSTTHRKGVKEIAFGPYGGAAVFSDYKTPKLERREVKIRRTGVYALRVRPGGLTGKVIDVKLERRPAPNAPGDFSTDPEWVSLADTTYFTTYDTRLAKVDTAYVELYRSVERLNSRTNLGGTSVNHVTFQLPTATTGELSREYPIG